MRNLNKAIYILFAFIIVGAAFLVLPVEARQSLGISNLDRLFLSDGSTGTILNVNQTSTGPIFTAQNDGVTVWSIDSGGLPVVVQQSEAVTATWVITPTSSYIVLSSTITATSSTATPIITTTASAGQQLILLNGNASIPLTLDGTGGTVECKADIAMGAGDTVTLIYESLDRVWYCLSQHDNS